MQTARKKSLAPASVRFGQRVPLDVHVKLRAGSRVEAAGVIRNASVSGAFVATALELPLYSELVVTLRLHGEAPATHALAARVVRIDANGFGVEWRDTNGADVVDLLQHAC
jgi:hypothetical protein